MTEEQARSPLRLGWASTFYVVRSQTGRVLPVQQPSEDCEILATMAPPSSGQASTFE